MLSTFVKFYPYVICARVKARIVIAREKGFAAPEAVSVLLISGVRKEFDQTKSVA